MVSAPKNTKKITSKNVRLEWGRRYTFTVRFLRKKFFKKETSLSRRRNVHGVLQQHVGLMWLLKSVRKEKGAEHDGGKA
jgi:hypothetical protein